MYEFDKGIKAGFAYNAMDFWPNILQGSCIFMVNIFQDKLSLKREELTNIQWIIKEESKVLQGTKNQLSCLSDGSQLLESVPRKWSIQLHQNRNHAQPSSRFPVEKGPFPHYSLCPGSKEPHKEFSSSPGFGTCVPQTVGFCASWLLTFPTEQSFQRKWWYKTRACWTLMGVAVGKGSPLARPSPWAYLKTCLRVMFRGI